MHWHKLGCVYEPLPTCDELQSHAANPVAVRLGEDVYRIFFSGRDRQNRSSVGYFDFDMERRRQVGHCSSAVFSFGPPHSFYSHGVSIGCCYQLGGISYIMFMGWHIPEHGHWAGEIGRLRLNGDFSLSLTPDRPILPISSDDPISLSYPWVMQAGDGSYSMWYGTTLTWDAGNGEMLHVISEAVSADGMCWIPQSRRIPFAIGVAQAFSRPTMRISKNGTHQMWFSYRSGTGTSYRIGFADSADGADWKLRLDHAGIDVSPSGWDSEMIEYPFVFSHRDTTYMLYNGNGFGRSGIGLARLQH
jgi:hypothetical protein